MDKTKISNSISTNIHSMKAAKGVGVETVRQLARLHATISQTGLAADTKVVLATAGSALRSNVGEPSSSSEAG